MAESKTAQGQVAPVAMETQGETGTKKPCMLLNLSGSPHLPDAPLLTCEKLERAKLQLLAATDVEESSQNDNDSCLHVVF